VSCYYPANQTQELFGSLKNIADTARDNHLQLARDIQERTSHYQQVRSGRPKNRFNVKRTAVGQTLVQRYGLIVTETEKQVTVPPQNPATPAQIAAALYRGSCEKWPTAHFTVSDEVADQLIKMTVQDNRSDVVSFDNIAQNGRLLTAQKSHERQTQEPERTIVMQEQQGFDNESGHQIDDFVDDKPGGPSLG
jgi:hypothetical protein